MTNIIKMYRDGFSRMDKTSRRLWIIILIKILIMFGVLKVFFFQGYFSKHNDKPPEEAVFENLMRLEK